MIRKYTTVYKDQSITFWPCYFASKFVFWLMIFVIAITWLVFFCSVVKSQVQGQVVSTQPLMGHHIIIVFTITFIAFATILFLKKVMWLRICLSDIGISINNKESNTDLHIKWEEVRSASIYTEGWYGRKSLRLHYEGCSPALQKYGHILIIPLGSVDCEKILNIIPAQISH